MIQLSPEDLTELQTKVTEWKEAPNIFENGVNVQYEAKKAVDRFSMAMSVKYGYDYAKHSININTGVVKPL